MYDLSILEYANLHKHIVCYGAGRYGRIIRNYLYENGIDIDAFLVTDFYYRKKVLGKPVFKIDEIDPSVKGLGIIICGNSSIIKSMKDTLHEMSFCDYFVVDDDLIKAVDNDARYETLYEERGRKRIILYHRIIKLSSDTWQLATDPEFFEWQINYLVNNYQIVPFNEIRADSDAEQVAITFDDGYFDNYTIALPILEKYKAPATFFVASGNIGTDTEFWWDEIDRRIVSNPRCPGSIKLGEMEYITGSREEKMKACWMIRNLLKETNAKSRQKLLKMLSDAVGDYSGPRADRRTVSLDELKAMDNSSYATIGGHTVSHSCLSSLNSEEKRWEIEKSKADLEGMLGHKLDSFAFPFGRMNDYDDETIRIALEAGYSHIAAVDTRYQYGELERYNPERNTVAFEGRKIEKTDWKREFIRFMTLT